MVSIGIDPSINSTGVCVMRLDDDLRITTDYYAIGHKPSKATLEFFRRSEGKFNFKEYGKLDYSSEKEYWSKELLKTESIVKSSVVLSEILLCNSPDVVVMEGVSYGSTSGASIVDLAGLNFMYRYMILCETDNMVIASPMEIKKFATGNGGVDKDIMVRVWSICEKLDIDPKAKIDDLADAYFMALYGACKCYPELEKSFEIPKVEIPKREKKKKKDDNTDSSIIGNFTSIDI
jgi:Holliday junction resolvasome RuvABC endonuclease subunit